ncbi:MAG: tRNA pseudouridine(38-40) synthase TruA [Bacteroidales bacterium]|nr:tRNA pseudouridine(38-40) synthase TruA [Bacteroidales bacterium]MDD6140061.1 tRNA pseudouridine(38-40) synthase TruA [Bacteroidales bacterium]MDD6621931.1 tRNA pseudouridine(38-40) synthase TruA [Bacteroidales bacterium]MDD6669749.1 tRNA pseudouridine(38-40) synthase TruA [Bacteroidales bacterium]
MPRYFLHLAYNGADYHGWQSQPNAVTVQETVEKALSKVLRRQVAIVGAGRTDTGVNARSMYAHFDVDDEIADPRRLIAALNSLVGRDIAVYGIRRVADDAHARFDAVARTYKYFITTHKSPFDYHFAWNPPYPLDVDAMNAAAARLADYIDFTSFSKLHTDVATNNCRIYEAQWTAEGDRLTFTIKADRFLRNMVRAIVGTLVDVGRGKTSVDEFCRIIERKDRCAAGASVPGNALFLWQVDYPYEVD